MQINNMFHAHFTVTVKDKGYILFVMWQTNYVVICNKNRKHILKSRFTPS